MREFRNWAAAFGEINAPFSERWRSHPRRFPAYRGAYWACVLVKAVVTSLVTGPMVTIRHPSISVATWVATKAVETCNSLLTGLLTSGCKRGRNGSVQVRDVALIVSNRARQA